MEDCLMCTDDGYKVNREGYTLCKQHYEEMKEEGSNTDGQLKEYTNTMSGT